MSNETTSGRVMRGTFKAFLAMSAAALGLGATDFVMADATEDAVLAFLNNKASTATLLREKTGITSKLATAIFRYRNGADGRRGTADDLTFAKLADVKAKFSATKTDPLDAATVATLREKIGATNNTKPLDEPTAQLKFATALFAECVAANFDKWDVYPGLEVRREKVSLNPSTGKSWGLAQARPVDGFETWGVSFFNAPASAYIKANLWPMGTFKKAIVDTGKKVVMPTDTVICKLLFSQKKEDDSQFSIEAGRSPGANAPKQRVYLKQMDISTKRLGYTETWTWATYVFDKAATNKYKLAPYKLNGYYVGTRFDQVYYGPIDNPRSSCIACHQGAQYPPVSISSLVNSADHFTKRDTPWPTKGHKLSGGKEVKLDYMWEATQSLQEWEKANPTLWPTTTTVPNATNAPTNGTNGGTTTNGGTNGATTNGPTNGLIAPLTNNGGNGN